MRKRLSKLELNILEQINYYYNNKGYPPSYKELGLKVFVVPGTIGYYLTKLRKEGYLTFDDHVARSVRLLPKALVLLKWRDKNLGL